ncbi:putative 28S rRNA (cytosine-C(5))-methyltransferase [Nibea albiflora]|uniref:28S rRNA (Cytosine-C(5))-methyltransferase n=1 Tax=Nibea albiflora TaxID=240163 RepID=A0ACB7EPA6_NIBAL|nr:putative 28S rRNA (cytosine-C(5))-methyltransferase [Nibea albiflora]
MSSQGQLDFSDRVFLLASVVFQNIHLEKPAARCLVNYGKKRGLPLPEVKDEEMLRTAYELTFNTLKYQELLEYIITDSCFYLTHPVFLPRKCRGNKEIIQEVRDVENYLLRFKTKLAVSLARYRIKHDLCSIECILPEIVRTKQERSRSLPLYAWINTLKGSLDEVQCVLKSAGFSQVKSIGQLEGQTFCLDAHCVDALVFPAHLKAQLYSTKLLSDHKLIIQDKSCSLGPNAVCSLLPEESDVLMVGCFSGLTVSHTASLIAEKHKAISNNQPTVYVCVSDHTSAQREELQQAVAAMDCKNVKLIPEDFLSLDSRDKRLQKVCIILLTPKCSLSAVSNPIEFILQENGVPKVLAVVYTTCSSYLEENEEVVSRALEQANAHSEQEGDPKQPNFRLSPSPFSILDHADGQKKTDPFFTLEPSEESNGCFLAVLDREPRPVFKEPPHEVILRANAKGILDRIGSNQKLTRKEQHGHTNRTTKTTHAATSQPNLSIQSKNQEIKGSKSTTLCGQQESTNWWQFSQGKTRAQSLQCVKNTVSSSFSSSRQENSTTKKSTPPFDTITSDTTLHPPAPPVTPLAPVVRPRRAQQEVLKPVVLTLPQIYFPNFFPPQQSRQGYCPSFNYNKWRAPTQTVPLSRSSGSFSKDAWVRSRPLF